jgi:alpha-galactosidase
MILCHTKRFAELGKSPSPSVAGSSKRQKIFFITQITLILYLLVPVSARPVSVSADELTETNSWVTAKFEGRNMTEVSRPYLVVGSHLGSIEKDGVTGQDTGSNKPVSLRIGNKVYDRGLHFPKVGEVVVHLPEPGKSFDALTGVDSNDLGYYSNRGEGSVIASVEVNGVKAFTSSVMREGMAAVPVHVSLKGAEEFILEVMGTGQGTVFGVDFDQADWADARVTLEDGAVVWLDRLPIGPLPRPYTTKVPFSFQYDGRLSSTFLRTWRVERSVSKPDSQRTKHTLVYTDPRTGLEVRCVAVVYSDFPVVEWTMYFKNTGTADTPILENIEPLDTSFERNNDAEFVLHYNKGSSATPTDFEPFAITLAPREVKEFSPVGGRPTNGAWPYFNVERPGGGIIVAVGWPGEWMARFSRDQEEGLRIEAGQQLTHFLLHPGEQVRTPLIALEFYKGDWIRGQNIWRRWMIAHVLPRVDGKLPPPLVAANSSHEYIEMQDANEHNQIMFIRRYLQDGFRINYWWMDAGWYPFKGSWADVGTWEPDPKRFPHGLRAVSDYAHSKGVKIIVWFEPERVMPGTWLYEHHPEWLLKPPPNPGDQAYGMNYRLLNLGNPRAREWLTKHVDSLIKSQGINLYRQDFNMDPLYFWRAHDSKDREGITEIRYVTGLLKYWDALRHDNPGLLIDSCASGGRRMDLETLHRAVVLTSSDDVFPADDQQLHTYGRSLWVPYAGTGVDGLNRYVFRSQMTPGLILSWDLREKNLDYSLLRQLVAQWREVAPDYFGDYYPLTPYSIKRDVWMAWEFNRPKLGEGMVQAFRRSASPYETAQFRLRGLDSDAQYEVRNVDLPGLQTFSGRALMDEGIRIRLARRPSSALLIYNRIRSER